MTAAAESLQLHTATGLPVEMPLVGAGSRAYAFLIDWHIRVGATALLALARQAVTGLYDPTVRSWLAWVDAGLVLASIGAYVFYHPVVELILRGDSPGKRAAGLRCVDGHGEAPSAGAVLLRNVMRLVDGLPLLYITGFVSVNLSRQRQRLGDMVAGTYVVRAPAVASEKLLAELDRVSGAGLDPAAAEFTALLLERWPALSAQKRREFASSVLRRAGVTPDANDRVLRRQLQALLAS